MDMHGITAEDIEFARFASGEFATWGFTHLQRVERRQMTYKQYIHEMLLLVLTRFRGDAKKSWRFLAQNVSAEMLADCQLYVASAHQQLVKDGFIKEETK